MIDDMREHYMKKLHREAAKLFYQNPWLSHNYYEHFMLSFADDGEDIPFIAYFEQYSVFKDDKPYLMCTVWIHLLCEEGFVRKERTKAIVCIFSDFNFVPKDYMDEIRSMKIKSITDRHTVFFTDFSSGKPEHLDNNMIRLTSKAMIKIKDFLLNDVSK